MMGGVNEVAGGVRQCAADGCNAIEFRTTGWCHRHKDLHEPLPPVDSWWTDQVEEVQEDEFAPTAHFSQTEKSLAFTDESNDIKPDNQAERSKVVALVLLLVVGGLVAIVLDRFSEADDKDSIPLELQQQQQSYEPESTAELWNHSFNEPEGCFPYVYSWGWDYVGYFSFEWDIDLSCAILSDLTVALSLVDSDSGVEYSGSLTYSTYYDDWDTKSLTLSDIPDGSYWLYCNAQIIPPAHENWGSLENQYVHEVVRVYVVLNN
jgi:DNA-binding transcriptional regulator YdaS (Cro superfamily)